MKCLSAVVFIMTCAVVLAGVSAGQEGTAAGKTPSAAVETKSLVQGKVVQEPGGQGIRKVRVILRGGSIQGQVEATTDETGEFKIPGLEPGIYFVRQLERSGYVADGKANRDKATIKLVAGQYTKDVVLRMFVAGTLTGKIVDTDGDPLRDVGVIARLSTRVAQRGIQTQWNGTTNDLGEYRIADMPPGKYTVQAAPPRSEAPPSSQNEKDGTGRLVYVTTYYPGTLDQRQSVAVEVFAGGTANANFGVLTSRGYHVSGTVRGLTSQLMSTDKSSENLAGLMMGTRMGQLVLIGNNGQSEEQNLGENGKFEFQNVLPGTYRAQVIIMGFSNGQPSLKMQTISTPIEVNGTDVVSLQLQADRGGDVSGRFHGEGDEKVDWKSLYVVLLKVPESGQENDIMPMGESGVTQLSGEGSFEIRDAPAGNYQLAVGAHSEKFRDYYTKSVLLGGREVADTGFPVSSSTALDVVVSAKGAGIEGSVVDDKGKPVAGATVVTVPGSGKLGRPDAYQSGVSDENGHFLLRGLNPGGFLVLAFEEMQENVRSPEFAHKYEGRGEKVELEEGGRKSVVLKVTKEDSEP